MPTLWRIIGDVISLQKAGRNHLRALSFSWWKNTFFQRCRGQAVLPLFFGCGRSGDVFKFIEGVPRGYLYGGCPNLRSACRDWGWKNRFIVNRSQPRLTKLFMRYARRCSQILPCYSHDNDYGRKARNYLYQRGLTDEVPNILDWFSTSRTKLSLSTFDLSVSWRGFYWIQACFYLSDANQFVDTLHNRIMFPLTNDQGKVIAFSGRIWQKRIHKLLKYKNSRSTAIFNKSYELYHMDRAKDLLEKASEIYLMEGFMDVGCSLSGWNRKCCGVDGNGLESRACWASERLTKKLVLVYDGDKGWASRDIESIGWNWWYACANS